MMLWLRFSIVSVLLALSAFAYANGGDWAERGNGGDVVICQNHAPFFYDPYEAERRYQLIPKFPSSRIPCEGPVLRRYCAFGAASDIAGQLIDRLKNLDPKRWNQYHQWLKTFESESNFLENTELLDIPDTGIGFIPPNCELRQLVIQREPKFPHDRRYLISAMYWDFMSGENMAAAIIHELLYREAVIINPEVKTSEPLRYFNALLLAGELEKMSKSEYETLVQKIFYKP